MTAGDTGPCGRCGRKRPLRARGLCSTCHDTCRLAGHLAEFGWVRADRLAEFGVLRERRYPVEAAGARVGVSARTAWRYEAARNRETLKRAVGWPVTRSEAA